MSSPTARGTTSFSNEHVDVRSTKSFDEAVKDLTAELTLSYSRWMRRTLVGSYARRCCPA